VKLKDDVGNLSSRLKWRNPFNSEISPEIALEALPAAEGCGESILAVLAWVGIAILALLFLWLFGTLLWSGIVMFIAMLYWIFFRALRLVFKNSNRCKGDVAESIKYAIGYTILYNFWIYGVILGAYYMR